MAPASPAAKAATLKKRLYAGEYGFLSVPFGIWMKKIISAIMQSSMHRAKLKDMAEINFPPPDMIMAVAKLKKGSIFLNVR